MDLHERSPVGRWATGRRDGRWFERFAEMCQGITSRGRSHPGLLPLANLRFEVSRLLPAVSSESDVATTPRAPQRSSPTRVMQQQAPAFALFGRRQGETAHGRPGEGAPLAEGVNSRR